MDVEICLRRISLVANIALGGVQACSGCVGLYGRLRGKLVGGGL